MKSNVLLGWTIVVGLVVTGCASTRPVATTTEDTEAFAGRLIAEKVSVAADAQRDFVAMVAEDQDMTFRKQAALDTDAIDVDFIGAPQELLQTMAHRYGYRYIESGKRSDLRTINVRVLRASPVEVLRNIGHQVDAGAEVVLDVNEKVLRLVYKNAPSDGRG